MDSLQMISSFITLNKLVIFLTQMPQNLNTAWVFCTGTAIN